MKDCGQFEEGIRELIGGTPRFEQMESVVDHCRECSECRQLFELHRTLDELGARFDELESVSLDRTRSQIVESVMREGKGRPWWKRLALLWVPFTLRPLTAMALFAVMFAVGIAVSRMGARPPMPAEDRADEAFIAARLQNMNNSPYSFSNVAVKEVRGDRVTLVFDVTRRVEIVQPMHSKIVKGVLTHAIVNPIATGAVGHFETAPPKNWNIY